MPIIVNNATVEAFATVAELATFRGRVIADDKQDQAEQALRSATAAIRRKTRQTISYVADDTVSLRGNWSSQLWLPERPVQAVGTLLLDDVAITNGDYRWDTMGLLLRTAGGVWPWPDDEWRISRRGYGHWGGADAVVTLTYSHGLDPIPQDLKDVCLARANRRIENPASVRSETLGPLARDFNAAASEWEPGELETLNFYRRRTFG